MSDDSRSQVIFGNPISDKDFDNAVKTKADFVKKFGDDSDLVYHLQAKPAPIIGERLGVRWLQLGGEPLDLYADAAEAATATTESAAKVTAGGEPSPIALPEASGKPVVVGNIRMGFGHYRISMAMASAARALGYTPYWFDLCGFPGTTCTKVVQQQNKLYSMGSRLSQKVGAFNKLYWEPLNSEGFRQLTYNASDQMTAQLFTPVYRDLPQDVPFIGTHVWPAQGAIHAGLTHVVNAIPDNWPMALHLSEGAIHTVQTPSSYLGYKMLRGMDKDHVLSPMPEGSLVNTGHYIDHELVVNIPLDCEARMQRAQDKAPVRYLICVGGAGAQQDFIRSIIQHLLPAVERGEATLLINCGDHEDVLKSMRRAIPELKKARSYVNNFSGVEALCDSTRATDLPSGIYTFCDADIFGAVYSTNLLMRICDFLVTKPSELAFYPVPKLMIRRVGGHEAWGAIRAAELGDGTYELSTADEVNAVTDLIQSDRGLLTDMCEHILTADAAGIYDGAYKVVRLATGE